MSMISAITRKLQVNGQRKLKKKALIRGVSGQDVAYLAGSLMDKGYEVHGIEKTHFFVLYRSN